MHIRFDHLTFAYPAETSGRRNALHDICLEFDTQRITGICGVTGSGKSTFIRQMNGILKPSAGRALIDGEDIHQSRAALRRTRQRIGMTFQCPERQFWGQTVWEELAYTLEKHRVPAREIDARVHAACQLLHFDLHALRTRSPFSLSRGEQRTLGIAVILTLQPELLVLDEATAGMDRSNASQLLALLQTLHRTHTHQVVFVSHDLDLLLTWAQYIIVLHRGEILLAGPVEQILQASQTLRDSGIRLPAVFRTLGLLREKCPQLKMNVNSLDEAVKEVSACFPIK